MRLPVRQSKPYQNICNKELKMKYFPKLKLYKASNVTYNPVTYQAYSYKWWRFVDMIDGKIIFNEYKYSMSTSRHQWKVRALLDLLGIKIDCFVEVKEGIGSAGWKEKALATAYYDMASQEQINLIKSTLKVKLTNDEIQAIYTQKEEKLCDEYLERAFQYQQKQNPTSLGRVLDKISNIA